MTARKPTHGHGWAAAVVDDVLVRRDAVDAAVVALAGLAAESGEQQRDDDRGRPGDRAAGAQGAVADRQARQVQALVDVVVAAADEGGEGDDDRGEDRP